MMKLLKKVPWGIIAGFSGIIVFFSTVGFVAANIILSAIAGATSDGASMFGTWYQVLLFVLDIIFGILFLGSLGMYIWRAVDNSKNKGGNVNESVENNI